MLAQPFSIDSLAALSLAEAQLRRALAGRPVFEAAERVWSKAHAEGTSIAAGRVDLLRGAIIARIARGAGTWRIVTTTHGEVVALVHAEANESEALAAAFEAEGIESTCIDAPDALARLERAESVALLPIEVEDARGRAQLRVFLFPRPESPTEIAMSNVLASLVDVDVALVTGITWIAARELETLAVGDALALDMHVPEGTYLGRLPGNAPDLSLRAHASDVIFEGHAARPRAPDARLEGTMQSEDVPLESWKDVEVELTLDVGQVRIALAELAALRVGAVLVPNAPSTDRVTIRANGRAIGRGTLVRVEGELAVRVDELAGAPERKPQ